MLSKYITDRQSQMPPHLAGLPHNVCDEVTFIITGRISTLFRNAPVLPGDIWVHYGLIADIRHRTHGWSADHITPGEKGLAFGYVTRNGEAAMHALIANGRIKDITKDLNIPNELLEPKVINVPLQD